MKIVDMFAVGGNDYKLEVTLNKRWKIVNVIALEEINEEDVKVKTGEKVKSCEDFDYKEMAPSIREEYEVVNEDDEDTNTYFITFQFTEIIDGEEIIQETIYNDVIEDDIKSKTDLERIEEILKEQYTDVDGYMTITNINRL